MGNPHRLAAAIESELRAVADPQRAAGERAYLKSDLEFLGAPLAAIRKAVTGALEGRAGLDADDALALAEALWAVPLFERRMAAVEVLTRSAGRLRPEHLTTIEQLLRESRTWALVDPLAINVAGPLVAGGHPQASATLNRWVEDADFWVRRSAVLALLAPLRQGGGDPDRVFRYADRLLDEKEFFIRKAIGWVLRDMSKRRPELVRDWLAPRTHRASGVTVREAVKYLADGDRDRLLGAYRAKRPAR